MCERPINLPKSNTPQTHHQDNNIAIALPVRPKQSPDGHSRVHAWSRDGLASRRVQQIHALDLAAGYGRVALPGALNRKYPNASTEWGWQFVFPQAKRWVDTKTKDQGRHVDASTIQKSIKVA